MRLVHNRIHVSSWRAHPARIIVLLCLLLPGVLSTNYTLNYFYGRGAAALDAGWFAALEAGAVAVSLPNPALISGSFFAFHMSPMFILLAALHHWLLPLPAPVFFALTQGFWYGLLGGTAAFCATLCLPRHPVTAATLGIACAGNGIVLATLGFPHVEIAIPALLAATLVLRLQGLPGAPRWLWACTLVLLLMAREDAGFQCAAIFGCLGLWRLYRGDRRAGSADAGIALLCACASAADLALQRHLFPTPHSMFATIYMGAPPFAHVTRAFLNLRLHKLFDDRAYVWSPLVLALAFGAVTRDALPALGSLACLPWCILACIAVFPMAGEMADYYAIPMMLGAIWPLISALPALQPAALLRQRYLWLQGAMLTLSIGLFVTLAGPNHDMAPWKTMGFGWIRRVGPMEKFTDTLLAQHARLGHLVVDDAVVSLRMAAFAPGEWRYRMIFSPAEQGRIDTLVSEPGTWTDHFTAALVKAADLANARAIKGTPFLVHSRVPADIWANDAGR